MSVEGKISYVEFPSKNIATTKKFFSEVFSWSFTDYGKEYTVFSAEGLNGGFYQADLSSTTASGGALIVLYSSQLKETQAKIEGANGRIVKPVFAFPGGHRFHFCDPNGNEYAVWSDKGA
ncbi:MAG: VOC family protein [Magnetococcales bacterium]|nr:VOC family protein [Magnetococcales bacterium]